MWMGTAMRLTIALMTAAAAVATAGAANAASVEIRDAVARVTVIPEDRNDVKVEFLTTNHDLPLQVRTTGGETIVDGGLARRITSCGGRGREPRAVHVRGVGSVSYDAIPQVVIRTPRAVVVEAGGTVFGAIGRTGSLDLTNSGCSQWTIADVAGDATLQDSGAGSVKMGSAGRLDLRLSGAGQVHATRVREGMAVQLSGAGGVSIDDFAGPMDAKVSGVGRIQVSDGHAGAMRAAVSGIGAVEFGGAADSLDASISGFGAIRVKSVTGSVTKSVTGGGHVTIGGQPS
jgi:hypothetical protein